jgi:ATP-dependent Clp protease protease subunit
MKKTFKLFGVIVGDKSERWSEDDVAPSQFKNFLATLAPDDEVELAINSPGGSVIAGLAIANMIASAPQTFTAKVYGIAASMATAIAAACDSLSMYKASYFMIHNPWSIALGDSEDLRKQADLLDSMKSALLGFYGSVFPGVERTEIARMMDEETWMLGSDASAYGLACALEDGDMAMAACVHGPLSFAKIPDPAKKFYDFDHTLKASIPAPADVPPAEPPAGAVIPPAAPPAAIIIPEVAALSERAEALARDLAAARAEVTAAQSLATSAGEAHARAEQQRRDIQSRADRLAADLDASRAETAAARAEMAEAQAAAAAATLTLSTANAALEKRVASMTLNALGAPSQACAQTWEDALAECGSYEKAKAAYPHLAEAYRIKKTSSASRE